MSDILTERENTIMRYRYWFNWEDKVTLENVWDLFWLTRERVRQLEKQSILKLRENQRFQQLIGV
jgi:DNA-directed RNA polymerase sigma subunit (sigma70/sigma32)